MRADQGVFCLLLGLTTASMPVTGDPTFADSEILSVDGFESVPMKVASHIVMPESDRTVKVNIHCKQPGARRLWIEFLDAKGRVNGSATQVITCMQPASYRVTQFDYFRRSTSFRLKLEDPVPGDKKTPPGER